MNPQASKWVTQVPPSWSDWLTAFGLLVKHGASVHEINSDRSLVHLNISHGSPGLDLPYPEPSALDFFRILHNECFMDFNLSGPTLWNPIVTAVRRRNQSRKALEFLSNVGVDLSRIASDGDTSLHWAAEMAWSAESIEYLCSINAVENISRQDAWGWTPLHYVVASTQYGCQEAAMDKAKCLLRHGADQDVKARKHPIFFVRKD
jgi:ankyrin repeat protein